MYNVRKQIFCFFVIFFQKFLLLFLDKARFFLFFFYQQFSFRFLTKNWIRYIGLFFLESMSMLIFSRVRTKTSFFYFQCFYIPGPYSDANSYTVWVFSHAYDR